MNNEQFDEYKEIERVKLKLNNYNEGVIGMIIGSCFLATLLVLFELFNKNNILMLPLDTFNYIIFTSIIALILTSFGFYFLYNSIKTRKYLEELLI